jgi:aminoglycoside/choline kinase family phosphotransferase
LPEYHSLKLQQELALFTDWYLRVHRNRPFTNSEWLDWNQLCVQLINSAREQPQVFVHRDFHSCNLLHIRGGQPGIIDFQDGVLGPISYDLVSLLWDRYIEWPRDRLEAWMMEFHQALNLDCDESTWIRWCDLMGLQRNLKIVGIFARLHYRDGKQGYLQMIPRFYGYLLDVLPRYPEFNALHQLLEKPECAP